MKVSIIIATYNRRHLIGEAIDSLLEQNCLDMEIIVVDDGSRDGTAAYLEKRYDGQVRCIVQPNMGFAIARNRGVDTATGEFIAFLDSDDIWKNYKLELQLAIMEQLPHLAFTFTDFIIFNESGQCHHSGLQSWFSNTIHWEQVLETKHFFSSSVLQQDVPFNEVSVYVGNLYRHLMTHPYVLPSTAMVRSSKILKGIKHTEGDPYCADWDFFSLLARDNEVGYIDCETTLNRSHDDGVRLTRIMGPLEKTRFRLESLNRIWKSDPKFMARHRQEVSVEDGRLWLEYAKYSYLNGSGREGLRALQKYTASEYSEAKIKAFCLMALCCIPYSGLLLHKGLSCIRRIT